MTRWLSLLFQAGGAFPRRGSEDPVIDSAAGREAVSFAQRFFEERWVPANDSIKSATYASDTWYRQGSPWCGRVRSRSRTPRRPSTSLDRDLRATAGARGSDFGGNALVATAQTTKPDLAASFLDFITRRPQMRDFCERASLLPTRATSSTAACGSGFVRSSPERSSTRRR